MRLAMRLPPKKGSAGSAETIDPREQESAEIIDLASRAAFPAVTDRKARGDGLGLAAGVAMIALIGAVTFWAMESARLPDPESVGNPDLAPPQAAVAAPAAVAVPAAAPATVTPQPDPAPAPVLANQPAQVAMPVTNPYASPTMVFDASRSANSPRLAEAPVGAPAPTGATGADMGNSSAAAFASRVGGVGGAPAQARAMTNPSTTVTEGTLIPAILETAINTDVPGYVRAVVSQDVRSFDGKRVLIPRSSRLIGQYQSGVQQGQKRAYVIWTDL
ncbi:MAG: TrbI/VirB10 family protein, partial [Erythrobacter sp.]|nr:TrbI/VirB10 family protein [Erythrobacter sp.]